MRLRLLLLGLGPVIACQERVPNELGAPAAATVPSSGTDAGFGGVSGDASVASPDKSVTPAESPPEPSLASADLDRTWVKLSVPQAKQVPSIVRTPDGWVALVREDTPTGGKAPGPVYNYLYRSSDGIRWQRLPFPAMSNVYRGMTQIVFGAGRYLVHEANGGGGQMWTSTDLAQWSPVTFPEDRDGGDVAPFDAWQVVRLGGLFVGLGPSDLFVSHDGVAWRRIYISLIQGREIAFGNDTFVIHGALSLFSSRDGFAWAANHSAAGDTREYVVFLDGRFYGGAFTSTDGVIWTDYAGVVPEYAVGGYLFNDTGDWTPQSGWVNTGLRAWRPGEPVRTPTVEPAPASTPLAAGVGPDEITAALPGGETCLTNRCIIVGKNLYLLR